MLILTKKGGSLFFIFFLVTGYSEALAVTHFGGFESQNLNALTEFFEL